MKLLLDENLSIRLRRWLDDHVVYSARFANLHTLKNGELLHKAAEYDFDALITRDQNIPFQHNLDTLPLAIVVLASPKANSEALKELVPNRLEALRTLKPRTVVIVDENGSAKFAK